MFILSRFIRTLRFIGAYAAANVQAAMEYRVSFGVQILTMVVNDSLWLFFWWSYFAQFPVVHGWKNTDIVVIWAVAACGFGISAVFFGNAIKLATLIMNGGLDAYLGMPRNLKSIPATKLALLPTVSRDARKYVLLHACISASDPTAWGDMIFAVGAFVLFLRPDAAHFGLFLLLSMASGLIFTAFFVIICSLSFWLGNTEGLAQQLAGALITFSTYPMYIFNGAVRVLLFTIIPSGFISFVPLQLLQRFNWPLLAAMLGFTALIVLVAVGVFQLGLRRYESGNLLGMQG